jgi:hypothetical protein
LKKISFASLHGETLWFFVEAFFRGRDFKNKRVTREILRFLFEGQEVISVEFLFENKANLDVKGGWEAWGSNEIYWDRLIIFEEQGRDLWVDSVWVSPDTKENLNKWENWSSNVWIRSNKVESEQNWNCLGVKCWSKSPLVPRTHLSTRAHLKAKTGQFDDPRLQLAEDSWGFNWN